MAPVQDNRQKEAQAPVVPVESQSSPTAVTPQSSIYESLGIPNLEVRGEPEITSLATQTNPEVQSVSASVARATVDVTESSSEQATGLRALVSKVGKILMGWGGG